MLKILSRIIQKVNMLNDLTEVLNIIVVKVKKAINADVCSVYLQSDENDKEYVLMATDGLNQSCVGQIVLSSGYGLVGKVALKGGGINLSDAQLHPDFQMFNELQETNFHGFCAIPIISHRKVFGVLVVQSKKNCKFSQQIVNFLFTIASQLSASIIHAKAVGTIPAVRQFDKPMLGSAVSPGVAIGRASLVVSPQHLSKIPDRIVENHQQEIELFLAAVARVKDEIKSLSISLHEDNLPAEDAAIFDAYLLMLDSSSFVNQTIEFIEQGNWAAGALRLTIERHINTCRDTDNRYLQDRMKDVFDLGQSVLDQLMGSEEQIEMTDNTVLIAEDFSAMTLSKLEPAKIKGIVSVKGSGTSHIAIVARALGIPTVMGVTEIPIRQLAGSQLIVDGYSGKVFISPSARILDEYKNFEQQEQELSRFLNGLKTQAAQTKDGVVIPLYVNLGVEEGLEAAKMTGAEGIGLFRTEFPFMMSQHFPGEKQQVKIYRAVLKCFAPQPVVLRTLDIGGDKSLTYFPIVEDNPFLGWRGIRISLDHPEIFIIQLRAMLIANKHFNNLHIMLPMVSCLDEIKDAKELFFKAFNELKEENHQLNIPKIGVMIEVPSLIFQIKKVVEIVDFISIGTNDLIQYLLAVDRNNPQVASIYQSLHPAVILAIKRIVDDAHSNNTQVSICGEMASEPLSCILLLGMGIDSLSTNISALPRIKWVIREFSQQEAKELLDEVIHFSSASQIKHFLEAKLEAKGLSRLIRAGG